jgi:hypothetical protein
MGTETQRQTGVGSKFSLITVLLIIVFAITACGEMVSVEDMDTGGGGSNSLVLSWTAPATNADGTPVSDLAGYKVYYGTRPGQYSQVVNVGGFTTAEVGGFASGTYYLSVTAYDIYGNESGYSNEIHYTFL